MSNFPGMRQAGGLQPAGYQRLTSAATARSLPSIPTGAVGAMIQCETQDIRIRFDGTDPTTTAGFLIAKAQEPWFISGDLSKVRIIETAASAIISVGYFA